MYVPLADPIKISRLRIRNTSARAARLSITAYCEWVLGASRAACAPFIVTEIDAATGAMFARNPWTASFGSRVAFADLAGRQTNWTGDRREFLGRNGTLAEPAALLGAAPLSKRIGAGLDPCSALQTSVHLEPGETRRSSSSSARLRTRRVRRRCSGAIGRRIWRRSFESVLEHWDEVLGTVQVKTPDRSMDIILNRWMLYQTLACRMWARSAFYQASGAFGFRDQLQDVMALAVSRPAETREHLLRAAARQFVEGDVQHWWHAADRPRRSHTHLRRSSLACIRGRALRRDDRRCRRAGRKRALHRRPDAAAGEHDAYFQPDDLGRDRRRSSSTARARSIAACRSASTACR